jgi:translation initiation factor IF-3
VIGADAEQLGVMTPEEAMVLAREEGLDLVEVAATSKPPVCRIMDYGKYKYEQKKKSSQSKKSHSASLKEVKLRPGTDLHDLNFKLNNVRRFLMDGDKVKVTVMFRGREMVHTSRGRDQLKQVVAQLGPIAKMENPPRMEGRFMSMILIGERDVVAELRRKEEEARLAEAAADPDGLAAVDEVPDEAAEDEEKQETKVPAAEAAQAENTENAE